MANLQLTKNLYNYRTAHGYTQERISKLLNISRQAYSNYETGKRDPDVELLISISELYGITLNQLILDSYTTSVIRETRPPYVAALDTENKMSLFLSKEESSLIIKYREADDNDRYLVQKILNQ